jgi:vancomycin resistance protein VanJ
MNHEQSFPARRRPLRKWTGRLCLAALAVVIAVTIWFRFNADENVYATLILFGPRWVAIVPVAALALISLVVFSWKGLVASTVMAAIIAGPFMGGRLPLGNHVPAGKILKIVSFNADAKDFKSDDLQKYLTAIEPDIVALQDADRVSEAAFPPGWKLVPAKNGLRLASKHPATLAEEFVSDVVGSARGAARFRVLLPTGDVTVIVLHLPTPRNGLEAILARKPNAIEDLRNTITHRNKASRVVREWVGEAERVILAGDFNLPVESTIYHRDWSGFTNCFDQAGEGWGYTMFSKKGSVRIDHVLVRGFSTASWDVGPNVGSAHRPVCVGLIP